MENEKRLTYVKEASLEFYSDFKEEILFAERLNSIEDNEQLVILIPDVPFNNPDVDIYPDTPVSIQLQYIPETNSLAIEYIFPGRVEDTMTLHQLFWTSKDAMFFGMDLKSNQLYLRHSYIIGNVKGKEECLAILEDSLGVAKSLFNNNRLIILTQSDDRSAEPSTFQPSKGMLSTADKNWTKEKELVLKFLAQNGTNVIFQSEKSIVVFLATREHQTTITFRKNGTVMDVTASFGRMGVSIDKNYGDDYLDYLDAISDVNESLPIGNVYLDKDDIVKVNSRVSLLSSPRIEDIETVFLLGIHLLEKVKETVDERLSEEDTDHLDFLSESGRKLLESLMTAEEPEESGPEVLGLDDTAYPSIHDFNPNIEDIPFS